MESSSPAGLWGVTITLMESFIQNLKYISRHSFSTVLYFTSILRGITKTLLFFHKLLLLFHGLAGLEIFYFSHQGCPATDSSLGSSSSSQTDLISQSLQFFRLIALPFKIPSSADLLLVRLPRSWRPLSGTRQAVWQLNPRPAS